MAIYNIVEQLCLIKFVSLILLNRQKQPVEEITAGLMVKLEFKLCFY